MRIAAALPPVLRSPAEGADRPGIRRSRVWPLLVACLAVAALTLLFPSTPTYDPWAWLLWGREILHLDLVTEGGPSWKPLPVLFTVPFSIFGASAAPYLWLWIARAGAIFSLVMAYRTARRLVGRGVAGYVAGIFAAAFLLTTYQYVRDSMLGNSEAMLAGVVLWALERHLDGRRDHALYLGFAAALLRPEAWPFIGLYGLWLWFREPELRLRVAAVGVAIPVLWFGPELWGSGEPLRASSRANNPNPGSAAFADHPGLEVVKRFHERTVLPLEASVLVAAVVAAVAWFRERRQGLVLAVLGAGVAWIALVAFMTERGYAGNQRYLIVTTACVCVLGGVGMARIFQGVERGVSRLASNPRAGLAAAAGIFALGIIGLSGVIKDKVDNIDVTLDELRYEASLFDTLPEAVDKAGGRDRLLACGGVYSGPFQTQMVAYELGVHGIQVGSLGGTPAPGVAFRTHTVPDGPLVIKMTDDRFREVSRSGRWQVWTAPRSDARGKHCPSSGSSAPRVKPTARTPELSSSR
jgi:hypothetical protein